MTELNPPTPVTAEGGLPRLLETEARMAARLAAAEAEARELHRVAHEAALAAASELASQVEETWSELARRIDQEREAELLRIDAEMDGRCHSLRDLPDARVEELATAVVAQLLGATAGRSS